MSTLVMSYLIEVLLVLVFLWLSHYLFQNSLKYQVKECSIIYLHVCILSWLHKMFINLCAFRRGLVTMSTLGMST